MRASLSQIILAQESDFNLGGLIVSPSKRQVVAAAGEYERLQPRIMQVLVALALRRGEVVSRDEMMAVCWGGFAVSDDAINRCIARIRRLAETHGGFTLETIARVGYQLNEEGSLESTAMPALTPAADTPMLPEASISALLAPEPVLDIDSPRMSAPAAAAPSWVALHGTVAVGAFAAGVLFTATLFVCAHFL